MSWIHSYSVYNVGLEIYTNTLSLSLTENKKNHDATEDFSVYLPAKCWVLQLTLWATYSSFCRTPNTVDSVEKVLSWHIGSVTCSSFTVVFLREMGFSSCSVIQHICLTSPPFSCSTMQFPVDFGSVQQLSSPLLTYVLLFTSLDPR